MQTHPYLRAYMAGIVVPTVAVALAITVFFIARYVFHVPIPVERVVIFPMALVPTLFGLWNMFYVHLHKRHQVRLGRHGALLPIILIPLGLTGALLLDFVKLGTTGIVWFETIKVPYYLLLPWLGAVIIGYYLVWKYLVGFCNEVLGIA